MLAESVAAAKTGPAWLDLIGGARDVDRQSRSGSKGAEREGGGTLQTRRIEELVDAVQGNILDLRAAVRHAACHLPGAASLPLEPQLAAVPPEQRDRWLRNRLPSIFLPARHEPLLLVTVDPDLAALVAAHLQDRGRGAVTGVALDRRAEADLPGGLRRSGRSARVLWRPPDVLPRWAHLLPPPVAGRALDLACGSGRAAVWLAARGWRVTGVDHQPEALALAARLAQSSGVALDLRPGDLRRRSGLPGRRWAVILLLRFLDRDLVARLPSCLIPGGVALLSTFRDAPGYLGNPRPRHRLRCGEAAGFWPRGLMEILVHAEGFDADGRPSACVVARRTDL